MIGRVELLKGGRADDGAPTPEKFEEDDFPTQRGEVPGSEFNQLATWSGGAGWFSSFLADGLPRFLSGDRSGFGQSYFSRSMAPISGHQGSLWYGLPTGGRSHPHRKAVRERKRAGSAAIRADKPPRGSTGEV